MPTATPTGSHLLSSETPTRTSWEGGGGGGVVPGRKGGGDWIEAGRRETQGGVEAARARRQLLTQVNEERSPGCIAFSQRPLEGGRGATSRFAELRVLQFLTRTHSNKYILHHSSPHGHLYIIETIVSQNNTYPYDLRCTLIFSVLFLYFVWFFNTGCDPFNCFFKCTKHLTAV